MMEYLNTNTIYNIKGSITGNNCTFELSENIEYNIGELEIRHNGKTITKGAVSITVNNGVMEIKSEGE